MSKTRQTARRALALMTFAISLATIVFMIFGAGSALPVKPFNHQELDGLRTSQRIVIVEFTSKYCATCQWNEYTLHSRSVVNQVSKQNVVVMKAVMPEGADLLKQLGFSSVPVLAIFPGRGTPIVMPDVVTKAQVLSALETAHEYVERARRRHKDTPSTGHAP